MGFNNFRVDRAHRGTGDNHRSAHNVPGRVAFVDRRSKLRQPVGHRTAAQVGAGDFHLQVEQDLGNPAHTNAADTDEVRVLGCSEHES